MTLLIKDKFQKTDDILLQGVLTAVSTLTYPAISAFVSMHADADKQGLVQGIITGIRGLCNGLGPAMYGLIFYLFHVDLNEKVGGGGKNESSNSTAHHTLDLVTELVPGPPFVFGALLVILAVLVAAFIPEAPGGSILRRGEDGEEVSRNRRRGGRTGSRAAVHRSDDSYSSQEEDEYKLPLIKVPT